METNRRQFLANVGRGAMVAAVGMGTAGRMGLAPAWAEDGPEALSFGALEPLVARMQETPVAQLVPTIVEMVGQHPLKELIAAAALANARTFGGEDYIGFHTMMALSPAHSMSKELPENLAPLPVVKVLYRNMNRIQEFGGRKREVLHPVKPAESESRFTGEQLREQVRRKDVDGAERVFASIAKGSPSDAFNALLYEVQDNAEIHRTALPYRAWDLLSIVGKEHAHTMLRQSLRYCLKSENYARNAKYDEPRTLLPHLFDQHRLEGKTPGTREADDAWVEQMTKTLFTSSAPQAADAVAAALAEGMSPDAVGEAISLAANQLLLRDIGRTPAAEAPGKPIGSVHGDSIGVHASDSANAWRHMAKAADARNTFACLILGAYQAAFDRGDRGGDFQKWEPLPLKGMVERVGAKEPEALLREAEEAIKGNLQARATAAVQKYLDLGFPARGVFDVCLKYAVSEEGALHAEKYYRTVTEEYAATRAAFRNRHLVALARVTASECGRPAAGMAEARRLLKV